MLRFILPVKGLTLGKSRLALSPEPRARLVEAMLIDTINAALDSRLGPVVVVSPDPGAVSVAEAHGASGVIHPGRLNQAINHFGQEPGRQVALLPDLPALKATELQQALAWAPAGFVADHTGRGTAMLFGEHLSAHFGPHSAWLHEQAGYARIGLDLPGLSHDIDTLEDLSTALRIGIGANTAAVLETLGADPRVRIGP